MPQANFDPLLQSYFRGQLVERDRSITVLNPLLAQVTDVQTEAATDDGSWTVQIRDQNSTGEILGSFLFAAVGQTAAQIAQGLVDAANDDPSVRGLLDDTGAELVNTDDCRLNFRKGGQIYDVQLIVDPSSGTAQITEVTAPGFTGVQPGDLVETDGSGGFQQWSGDGPGFLGVVMKDSNYIIQADQSSLINGPTQLSILQEGVIAVTLAAGVTVAFGDGPLGYDDVTREWHDTPDSTFVVVEGSQVRSQGTGLTGNQAVYIRGPLES